MLPYSIKVQFLNLSFKLKFLPINPILNGSSYVKLNF